MLSPNNYTAFTNPNSVFEDETPKVIIFHNHHLLHRDYNNDESLYLIRTSTTSHRHREVHVWKRMRHLICIASIGGFLSGYNTGVLSGALLPLSRVFSLSSLQGKGPTQTEKEKKKCHSLHNVHENMYSTHKMDCSSSSFWTERCSRRIK